MDSAQDSRLPDMPTVALPRDVLARAGDLLLSKHGSRRTILVQTCMGWLLMFYCVCMGLYAASHAGTPPAVAWTWAACSMLGASMVYGAIRMGWTERLPDPAMTTLQMSFSVTVAAIAYGMAGPLRGGVFPVLMVIMLFGFFALPPRVVWAITGYMVSVFGGVMLLMAQVSPQVYEPTVEWAHFLMMAAMTPVMPLLTARYAAIRERSARQHKDFQRVHELATRDELTGLMNRRQMTEMLQRSQVFRARTGRPYCVAVLDLDYFKRINDEHGHAVGDEVLRRFAEVAQASVRDNDAVARWGGEEFVLLMGDTRLAAAKAGVERLRERIEGLRMRVGDRTLAFTMSGGIAEPLEGETFERALSRADHALYVAKARGRNQVVNA